MVYMLLNEYTDVYYINKLGEYVKRKECILDKLFMFDRNDFILVHKNGYYYVGINYDIIINSKKRDNEIVLFWSHEMGDLLPGEIMGIFRKKYLENKINGELIENFIKEPLKYSLLIDKKDKKNVKEKASGKGKRGKSKVS